MQVLLYPYLINKTNGFHQLAKFLLQSLDIFHVLCHHVQIPTFLEFLNSSTENTMIITIKSTNDRE